MVNSRCVHGLPESQQPGRGLDPELQGRRVSAAVCGPEHRHVLLSIHRYLYSNAVGNFITLDRFLRHIKVSGTRNRSCLSDMFNREPTCEVFATMQKPFFGSGENAGLAVRQAPQESSKSRNGHGRVVNVSCGSSVF